ncbi:unnamed protein product [Mytilus edulis]|uniref:Uncharacterized protein n=1 Tax=Mytilus edulis TaxID=6550 RepID=A0A8S3UCV9_MYTED|nr:unnamed protein product [Mytilus edulis]
MKAFDNISVKDQPVKAISSGIQIKREQRGFVWEIHSIVIIETSFQNLPLVESIGNEQRSASESLSKLYSEGFEVRHITTDPDSSAYRAAEQLASNYNSKVTPEHLIDTRHFSDNHRKQIKKNEILTSLMPARTKKQREDLIGRFALDLSQRCHAEYKSALKHCDGNFQTFKRKLSHTVDAIILCYQSKHCICKRNSFVCKGIEDPWINKSIYLPKTFKLNLTLKQQSELRKCINYRQGPKRIRAHSTGNKTQKSECVNRIIRRSLPRSNTFSKNFKFHVSSANHGPGESVMALCLSVGAPVTAGSKVHTHLQQEQKIYENHKQYKKLAKYMKNRKQKAKAKFELYSKKYSTKTGRHSKR